MTALLFSRKNTEYSDWGLDLLKEDVDSGNPRWYSVLQDNNNYEHRDDTDWDFLFLFFFRTMIPAIHTENNPTGIFLSLQDNDRDKSEPD